MYSTNLVLKLSGATSNQLKYWNKTELVTPARPGKACHYSFKDIIKLKVLVSLRNHGLSLQKVRQGITNLTSILPEDEPLSRLLIYTDGNDMIVVGKGQFFNAITRQRYLCFDTEQISGEILEMQKQAEPKNKATAIDKAVSQVRVV